jgi:hypothetical protein
MVMLGKIMVHEGVMRAKDRVGMDAGGKKSMGEWVNVRKMEQVREAARATHGESTLFLFSNAFASVFS